ncbi:MAG: DUF4179 domain-containing protein [Anaerolineae bacterium]|nr:DUF4179 domain-containing protein [Anaerolineae bacterium]
MLVLAGIALALGARLQQLLNQDAGLRAVFESDLGTELNLSQTIDGYTVTLEWAYADGNRLTVAYTIAGAPGVAYTNLEGGSHRLLYLGPPPVELPGLFGVGNAFSDDPPYEPSQQVGNVSANTYTFDLTALDPVPDVLDLRLELEVTAVTTLKRTQIPDPASADYEAFWGRPIGPFVFAFSLPVHSLARVLTAPQTATDQGVAITLARVTVTSSQTRLLLCFEAPDPARHWTLIPRLTTDEETVAESLLGGGVREVAGETGHTCNEFIYNAAMYAYHDAWELEIIELVGFGSGGGNDQERIAGSWRFTFTVP